ncbi:MAG: FAD-dependent oxidoreductase [Chlorobi bacterium]|nr:FAD-dependent oxidoreductase [Chlorobiota bacterium]
MSFFNLKGILSPVTALKQFGKKPHTVGFPEVSIEASDRYRGLHFNDLDACIGCGNCSTICMNNAIDMIQLDGIEGEKGDSGLRPRVDNGRCCWCALCVEVCPTGSLNLTKEYNFVSTDASDFLWTPGLSNKDKKDKISFVSDKETSLTEYTRVPMRELDGMERIKSFAEAVLGYNEEEARREASRCISCSLCTESCPDHMHIPEYINAIASGNDADALRIIYDNNPLPEMCGKVCTRRCEDVCAISVRGEAVAIRWLKRYATETAKNADIIKEIVNPEIREANGLNVSVIGAGPSGLTVAYYLALRGYNVTIYEAKAKAGGMTYYGIPKYRLPEESLEKQVGYIQSIGVKINFNTRVGKDISFNEIYEKSDAVFMGVGYEKPWTLGITGEDLEGSLQAVTYLDAINSGKEINIGDKVAVIGGGNVAIDAARVARRKGADVTIVYRRRIEDMPADWEEIEGAEDEGVHIMQQGIPLEIVGKNGKVTGLKIAHAEMIPDPNGGRPRPKQIEGSEEILEMTAVIGAIGQEGDYSFLPEEIMKQLKIERGRFVVNEGGQTNLSKIFAGGDSVNKTADAISAIADGFRAVKAIDKFLNK